MWFWALFKSYITTNHAIFIAWKIFFTIINSNSLTAKCCCVQQHVSEWQVSACRWSFLFTLSSLFWTWLSSLCQYSWHSCVGFSHGYFIDSYVFAVCRELLNYLRSAIVNCFWLARHENNTGVVSNMWTLCTWAGQQFCMLKQAKFKLCNPVASKQGSGEDATGHTKELFAMCTV